MSIGLTITLCFSLIQELNMGSLQDIHDQSSYLRLLTPLKTKDVGHRDFPGWHLPTHLLKT
jgi:hypothetical protein